VTAVCRATHSSKSLFGRGWFNLIGERKNIRAFVR
jgi:hypothetical protein